MLIATAKTSNFSDADLLEFPLNLKYLEAEFFLFGALGYGLDKLAPTLTGGGPPPIGAKLVDLDPLAKDVFFAVCFSRSWTLEVLFYLYIWWKGIINDMFIIVVIDFIMRCWPKSKERFAAFETKTAL
ncbi:hypothetical protein VNO80_29416 [Phaseolus coccineus]|uniref:Uncharacterized protein n=1 Tax=Phaseolus coccineus TaxID=3886 RepID=A0AAN9QF00_PHACN